MRLGSRGGLVAAFFMVIVLFTLTLSALPARAVSPLTGSQVITVEHGPDGTWLSQAWIIELQARPDMGLTLIHDTWWHSNGLSDLALAYKQWDVSVTYAPASTPWLPWSVTAGARWRTGVSGQSLGGSGPWTYVMVGIGM